MSEFIPRAKAAAIDRALKKMIVETIDSANPGMAEEIMAVLQKGGGAEAVSALLKAKRDELDDSVKRLVAAAIAELDKD